MGQRCCICIRDDSVIEKQQRCSADAESVMAEVIFDRSLLHYLSEGEILTIEEFRNSTSEAQQECCRDNIQPCPPVLIESPQLDEVFSEIFERYGFGTSLQNELLSFCIREYEMINHDSNHHTLHIGSQIRDVPHLHYHGSFNFQYQHLTHRFWKYCLFRMDDRLICFITGKKLAFLLFGKRQGINLYEADFDIQTFNEKFIIFTSLQMIFTAIAHMK